MKPIKYRLAFFLTSTILLLMFSVSAADADSSCLYRSCSKTEYSIEDCDGVIDIMPIDDKNLCILHQLENNYMITILNEKFDTVSYKTEIESFGTPYAFCCGKLSFFRNLADERDGVPFLYMSVKSFDCNNASWITRTINNVESRPDTTFACDGSRFYMLTSEGIAVYSSKFKLEETIEPLGYAYSLTNSPDGSAIYCACSDGLLVIKNDDMFTLPLITERVFPFDDKFADDNSTVYGSAGNVLCSNLNGTNGAVELGGWYIGISESTLTAVKDSASAVLGEVNENSFIRKCGERCFCFTQDANTLRVISVTAEDIENLFEQQNVTTDIESQAPVSSTLSPFHFDSERRIITGINVGTTAAAFRRESSTETEFFKQNGSRVSVALGTGMKAGVDGSLEYTVVVFGDVTGEGNVNSSDERTLIEHVFGTTRLEGVYSLAADVNHDGDVTLADAAALHQCLCGRYEISQNEN